MSADSNAPTASAANFVSVVSAPTSGADLTSLPLDVLRQLAEHGPDSAARSAARRAIEARTANATELAVSHRVAVGRSDYGTPRPEVRITLHGGRGPRETAAVALELAAQLERALCDTREGWHVGVRGLDADSAAVHLDLWDGRPAEVQRAVSVLERLAGQAATTGRSAGRRPGKPRRVSGHEAAPADDPQPDTTATDEPDSTFASFVEPADKGPAAPSVADESESRSRRRKRQRYREAAGDAADKFEREQLADDRAMLPACARSVLGGGQKSTEYWQWLIERWDAVQQTEHAAQPTNRGAERPA